MALMSKKIHKSKPIGTNKERFEVLLEDMQSELHIVAEQTSDLMKLGPKVDSLIEDMTIVKSDIEIIKGILKRKVDVEEFEALTKRVAHLENKSRI